MAERELQVQEKQQVAGAAEQTRPGLLFTPAVDIFETEKELVLLADMPGVKPADLDIDLRENTLTLSGEVLPFERKDEQQVLSEYEVGKYYRQFTLSEVIDQEKIEAAMDKGVLRLRLPKVEKATPRKISVTAA
ncbi:MAG: Hsp20/alpha crystallin family protein [Desulfococcaceae bacterium]|jgi:HSP20 family molecular chaperone IbpA|nr:Hsp20/alpha crystallin family protein [Desulfococcaceae bacterium]